MEAVKLSVAIIAFNEEANIRRCIESVLPVADEVLLVDSGSTDKTVEIAKSMGARVVEQDFLGHIGQKNFAKEQAMHEVVLSIDADEALSEELRCSIESAKLNWAFDGYAMNRLNNYCGKWIRHSDWYPDTKLRLWDRRKGKWGGVNPHDKFILKAGASKGFLKGDLLHYTVRDFTQHKAQSRNFGKIGAEMLKGKSPLYLLFKLIFSPPMRFLKMFVFKAGFLDGKAGFLISIMTSWEVWLKYSGALAMRTGLSKSS